MLSGDGFPDDSDNGERDYSCMIMRVMKNKRMMMIMRMMSIMRMMIMRVMRYSLCS